MKEGSTVITIPAQQKRVCTGCKHLNRQAWVCGVHITTYNYLCAHPDNNTLFASSVFGRGRCIAYNVSDVPNTPAWCPLLNTPNK